MKECKFKTESEAETLLINQCDHSKEIKMK